MHLRLTSVLWIATAAAACGTAAIPERPGPAPPRSPPPNIAIDSVLRTLSTAQKVGQILMPWVLGSYLSVDSEEFDSLTAWVDSLEVGGIIVSTGSPLDVAAKLNALQRRAPLPLLVAADLEWGTGMRLIGGTAFPMPMALGATDRDADAYQLGRITALEARAVGIHLTFSPVADVNNNPANPIINTRAIGEDPDQTARLVAAYVRGAREHGLFTTAKHFPGHGDTETDTHIDLPFVPACWSRLDAVELVPFRASIAAGVTAVMTAHIALPCVDGDDPPPATLSPAITTGILRDSLGFGGLVVTDALDMGAIVRRYGPGESAVLAFLAGADLILMPADIAVAHAALLDAARAGRIPTERLDRSVARILGLKAEAGLFGERLVRLDEVPRSVARREFQAAADDIAARALTLVQRGALDAFRTARGPAALIAYDAETNPDIGRELARTLRDAGDTLDVFRLYPASGPASYDSARAVIERSPRVLFAVGVRFRSGSGHVQMPDSLAALIRAVGERPVVLASLGSPYLLRQLEPYGGTYLVAWSDAPATERAVARALLGRAGISGRLPITLSERFPRGHGIAVDPVPPRR